MSSYLFDPGLGGVRGSGDATGSLFTSHERVEVINFFLHHPSLPSEPPTYMTVYWKLSARLRCSRPRSGCDAGLKVARCYIAVFVNRELTAGNEGSSCSQAQKQGPGHRRFPAAASLRSGEAVQAG